MHGEQEPRICSVPPYVSSTGQEAIELAAMAGLVLDPWEQFVLAHSLGERKDGTWAAFEIGLCVPRQNGKGAILEARELAGLFLLGERLIIHSAHEFATSQEHFLRLKALVQETPELDRRVKKNGYRHSHGEEGIELIGGQRIKFKTRTKGAGRGFTGDLLVLDEAMILPEAMHGALLPTLSARPNPQVWYTGSAVDQLLLEDGLVFARVRQRGIAGDDPRLAYFEWSVDRSNPDEVDAATEADAREWAQANPGLGIRISVEHVEAERRSMDSRTFAVERLGVGDWPDPDASDAVFSLDQWLALGDENSKAVDPVCFSFDVNPDRSWSSIGVASKRADGLWHVEVAERDKGTEWLPARLAEMVKKHKAKERVYCDGASPAASLLPELTQLGIEVEALGAREHAQGCGLLYDFVEQRKLRHRNDAALSSAVRGAVPRPLGDAWAWSRKNSSVDISPLVAVTLALYGIASVPPKRAPLIAVV